MNARFDLISAAFWQDGPTGPNMAVRGLEGREAVSELFELRVLIARSEALSTGELDAVLQEPCVLRFEGSPPVARPEDPTPPTHDYRYIHGIVSRMERVDAAGGEGAYYYAEIRPRVWLLDQTCCSRIFRQTTVPEILRTVLADYDLTEGPDFELRLAEEPRPIEYVVQLEETDWAFLSRWLEHEGYLYWFEHDDGDRLIVADRIGASATSGAPIEMTYVNANMPGPVESLRRWNRDHRRTVQRVGLVDYDAGQRVVDGTSSQSSARWVKQSHDVPGVAFPSGTFSFGPLGSRVQLSAFMQSNLADGDGGGASRLAQVRAEAIASTRVTYRAQTDSFECRPGRVFVLRYDAGDDGNRSGSYDVGDDADQDYFVTALEHFYGAEVRHDTDSLSDPSDRNHRDLTAVRASTPLRPARRTPWPRVDGVLVGQVMGPSGGGADADQRYPHIDDHGRYKVRMPFAVYGGGEAYAWVRMAEPYAGQSYGSHQPLHAGAEVLLAHVAGNPDRPIIVGAVPHGSMPTPVAAADAPKARIVSAGGASIEMDDYSS